MYLLFGPPAVANDETRRDSRLYIGQADSVADRLDQHLSNRNKQWWRIVVIIRRPDKSPLDLSQCKFLESQLYSLGKKVGECLLMNKNTPQPAFLIEKKVRETRELMDSALIILSALGLNLFEAASTTAQSSQPLVEMTGPGFDEDEEEQKLREGVVVSMEPMVLMDHAPQVSANMRPVIEELRKTVTRPSFPKAEWYWTGVPDYRAKVVDDGDFRVFLRVRLAAKWLSISLKDVAKFKLQNSQDLEKHRKEILSAYQKAEEYLRRNK